MNNSNKKLTFEIEEKELEKYHEWYDKLLPTVLEKSKEYWKDRMSEEVFNSITKYGTIPYYGAIGGGLTFMFRPTGLGDIIKVKEFLTKEEIDITDYDCW